MITFLKYPLMDITPGAAGGGESTAAPAVDRGDELPEEKAPAAAQVDTSDATSAEVKAALKVDDKGAPDDKGDKGAEDDKDDKDDKDGKTSKDSRIPLSRHQAILERERAARTSLEAQLAQFQQGAKIATANADITALEEEVGKLEKAYNTAVADGEVDKATKLMAEIRMTDRKITETTSAMRITAEVARATEKVRYNTALERVEEAYPVLNPDHDDFDSALLLEVAELKGAYEVQGKTPTEALQKAVKLLVGGKTTAQKDAVDVKPRVADKDVAAERKAAAVTKTVEAISKTPPSTTRVGMDSNAMGGDLKAADVLKMTQEDFAKLSDSALAKMRGDEI